MTIKPIQDHSKLSFDLWKEIILKSDIQDLFNLLATSRKYQSHMKDESLWKRLIVRDFGKTAVAKAEELLPLIFPRENLYYTAYKTYYFIAGQLLSKGLYEPIETPPWFFLEDREIRLFHFVGAYSRLKSDHFDPLALINLKFKNFLLSDPDRQEAVKKEKLPPKVKIFALIILTKHYMEINNLAEAEKVALLFPDHERKKYYLELIADHYFFNNLAEAERVAVSASSSWILSKIALYFVRSNNLSEAERVAELIPDQKKKNDTLTLIASSYLSANKLPQAKKIALLITFEAQRNEILSKVATAYCPIDPSEAEKAVLLITEEEESRKIMEAIRVTKKIPEAKLKRSFLDQIKPHYLSAIDRIKTFEMTVFALALIATTALTLYQGE
jgi:hypothetical protein